MSAADDSALELACVPQYQQAISRLRTRRLLVLGHALNVLDRVQVESILPNPTRAAHATIRMPGQLMRHGCWGQYHALEKSGKIIQNDNRIIKTKSTGPPAPWAPARRGSSKTRSNTRKQKTVKFYPKRRQMTRAKLHTMIKNTQERLKADQL